MKRRDVREHWSSQAFMAMFGVIVAALAGILMATGGLLVGANPLQGFVFALSLGALVAEIVFGTRVLYCIYKYRKVGR